jgi:Patatin-like phospholipase
VAAAFDIGLVMAGAVSAGAYTGGTIDFLLQALDAWHDAKARTDGDAPPHAVRLKVATGASAGGMTAGMFATTLRENVPPITATATAADMAANKFYDAWVTQVSIEKLLAGGDLAGHERPVQSFLDSSVLKTIADRMFAAHPGNTRPTRAYVADPFVVAVTLTNLRGVPYEINFQGLAGPRMPYTMRLHADFLTFAVGSPRPPSRTEMFTPTDKAIPLDPTRLGQDQWPTLATAALATGAFPFGLAPQTLTQTADQYDNRLWYHPYVRTKDGQTQFGFYEPLAAAMGVEPDFPYEFTCVDGGTIDNEPIGLARELLGWNAPAATPSAVILIDPFPNHESFEKEYAFPKEFSLFRMIPALIGALVGQARFKPEELTRAVDPKVFNQFMLAPVRRLPGSRLQEPYPIACGGLGGFAGFLSEDFRAHDFRLGRLNAQSFLRRHFVLPEGDPLFAEWSQGQKDRFRVRRDADHRVVENVDNVDRVIDEAGNAIPPKPPLSNFLPIIPLMASVQDPEPSPTWPTYTRLQIDDLRDRVEARSKLVIERLIQHVGGATTRFFLRRAWWLKRDELLDDIFRDRIVPDLSRRGLLI